MSNQSNAYPEIFFEKGNNKKRKGLNEIQDKGGNKNDGKYAVILGYTLMNGT